MENNFKIPRYISVEGKLLKDGYTEFKITYLPGLKQHQLRVVVNGYLTKQKINLLSGNSGYKNVLLSAIKEYVEKGHLDKNKVSKKVTLHKLELLYSKFITHNVKTYLLKINKEENRDKLTKFGLINLD